MLENESCLKMQVWAFDVSSFEIGVFNYLMNIDEKFVFVKSFDVVYVLIKYGLSLFLDDLEAMRGISTEILKFCRTHVQWLVLCPMSSFTSNDKFCVQWTILTPMTSFDVNVINVCFSCVN